MDYLQPIIKQITVELIIYRSKSMFTVEYKRVNYQLCINDDETSELYLLVVKLAASPPSPRVE